MSWHTARLYRIAAADGVVHVHSTMWYGAANDGIVHVDMSAGDYARIYA